MRRILVLAAAVVALAGCGDDGKSSPPERVVRIGDATVRVEVAADEASRELGLGGRNSLGPDRGMLFVLADRSPAFWMKGMRFPLDIVWIGGDRVVDVSAGVPPPKGPNAPLPTYSPDRPADLALEVNAGWAARHDVGRGDQVRLPPLDRSG